MWLGVLSHQFLDDQIRNFQALPGSLTASSLTPCPDDRLQTYAVHITPGLGFEYILAESINDVIGISASMLLDIPFQEGDVTIPILKLGNNAEFSIHVYSHPRPATSLLYIGLLPASRPLELGDLDLGTVSPPQKSRYVNIRFDWHSSGEVHLLQDGKLVCYHNAAFPTFGQLKINSVVFGLPSTTSCSPSTQYSIGKVLVRVLRRRDALADLMCQLPDIRLPDDASYQKCYIEAFEGALALTDKIRRFSALVNQNLSQPWSHSSDSSGGPHSQKRIALGVLASKTAREFAEIMLSGDFSEPERFVKPLAEFLAMLHSSMPQQFEALVADMYATKMVPQECKSVLESKHVKAQQALGPLLALLQAASDRVIKIGGET